MPERSPPISALAPLSGPGGGWSPYGRFVASLASWAVAAGMQQVLFTWLIIGELHESSQRLGVAQMCQMLPWLALLLISGAVADRVDRRRLLSRIHLVSALASVALGVVVASGRLHIGVLIAWALAFGSLQTLAQPARDALLFDVVVGHDLMRAVTGTTLVQFSGQALGTGLAALADLGACAPFLWLQAAVFAVGALPLAAVSLAPPAPLQAGAARVDATLTAIGAGLREVWSSEKLRYVALLVAADGLFYMGPFFVFCPLLIRDFYAGTIRDLSIVMMGFTFGTMAGSTVVLIRGGIRRKGRAFLLALLGMAGCLVVIALQPRFAVFAATLVCWGMFHSVFFNTSRTLFQEAAPVARRARVNSIHSLGLLGMAPISNLLAGFAGDKISPLTGCAAVGAVMSIVVVAAWNLTDVKRLE